MKSTKAEVKANPPVTLIEPTAPETLEWETQQIGLAIAHRAYEIFEARNGEHGHDWEDWFQAESEMLRPVSIAMSESANRISVRVNIPGFSENELKIGIEPKGITIVGRRDSKPTQGGEERTATPNQVLRCISLTSEIDTAGAVIELESGVLRLELPKVATAEAKAAGAGTV
jgi:HSP20 family protein